MAQAQGRILLVDDDTDMLNLLQAVFEQQGYRCWTALDVMGVKEAVKRYQFDAILLDFHLGDETSLELIPFLTQSSPYSALIVMTAQGSIEKAVLAMEQGATTFVTKDEGPNKIVAEVEKRLRHQQILPTPDSSDNRQILESLGIIAQSRQMIEIMDQINQIKDLDATVLILGESGTGKELIARAIHRLSIRKDAPFEAINCAAIPETLLESELFGHVRGAFTDAKKDHKGSVEVCSEGSLFLDEIGEMPLALQAKILRMLQEKEIKPLGASRSIAVNTRIICATHRNLEELIAKGTFREDLYFRLNIFPLFLPTLRDRREDIPALVTHFLMRFNQRYNKAIAKPNREKMTKLQSMDWPGNIRQLQNAIERAVVLSKGDELDMAHMNIHASKAGTPKSQGGGWDSLVYKEAKEIFEREFIKRILTLTHGNVTEASRLSGRFRSDIYRLMEKYNIRKNDYQA